jgi:hypothetical protein
VQVTRSLQWKDCSCSQGKGARGKALAFGKLAGDAALGRLTHGQVRLSDFKGSPTIIAKRLARWGASYGLLSATGGALDCNSALNIYKHPTDVKSYTKMAGHLAKQHIKKYERKLLVRWGGHGILWANERNENVCLYPLDWHSLLVQNSRRLCSLCQCSICPVLNCTWDVARTCGI